MKKVLKIWLIIAMILSISYQSILTTYATQTEKISSLKITEQGLDLEFKDSHLSKNDFTFAIAEREAPEPSTYVALDYISIEKEKNYTLYMKSNTDSTVETYDFDTIAPKFTITKEYKAEKGIYTKVIISAVSNDAINYKVMKDNVISEHKESEFEITDPTANKIVAEDSFGNTYSLEINVSGINTKEEIPEITISPEKDLTKLVTVTIKEVTDFEYGYILKENEQDLVFDSENKFNIVSNGTYIFALKNKKTDIITKIEKEIKNIDTEGPKVGTANLDLTPSIDNLAMKRLGYVPFSANQLLVSVPITDSLSGINEDKTQLIVKDKNDIIKRYNISSVDNGQYVFKVDIKDTSLTMYLSTEDKLVNKVDEQRLSYTMNSEVMNLPILLDTNKAIISNEQIDVDVKTIDGKDWIKQDAVITYQISDLVKDTTCSGIQSIQTKVNDVEKDVKIDKTKKVDSQTITIKTSDYKADENGLLHISIAVKDNAGNESDTFTRKIYLDTQAPSFLSPEYEIKDGTITIYASDDKDSMAMLQYAMDGSNYQSSNQFTFKDNETHRFTVKDSAGNESRILLVDKTLPTVNKVELEPIGDVVNGYFTKANIIVDATDNISDKELTYVVSTQSTIPDISEFKKGKKIDDHNFSVGELPQNNGKVYVYVRDESGNIANYVIPIKDLEKIDLINPTIDKVDVISKTLEGSQFANKKDGFEMTIVAHDDKAGLASKAYAVIKLEGNQDAKTTAENISDQLFVEKNQFSFQTNGDYDESGTYLIVVRDGLGNINYTTKEITFDTTAPTVETAHLDLVSTIIDNVKSILGFSPFSGIQLTVTVPIKDNQIGVDENQTKLIAKSENGDIIGEYSVSSKEDNDYSFKVDISDKIFEMYISTQDKAENIVKEKRILYFSKDQELNLPVLLDNNKPTISNEQIDVDVKTIDGKDWIKQDAVITYQISDLVKDTTCSGIQSIQTKVNDVEKDIEIDKTKKVDSQTITIKTSDYKADKNGLFYISIAVKDNAGNESEAFDRDIYLDTQAPIVETANLDLTPSIDNLAMKTLGYVPFSANQLLVSVPITDSLSGINEDKTQLIVKDKNDIIKRYNISSVDNGQYMFKVDIKDISLTMYLSTEDKLVNKVDEQRLSYTMNSEAMDLPILLDTNKPIISNEQIDVDVKKIDDKDWIKQDAVITYQISDIVEKTTCSGIQAIQTKVNDIEKDVEIDKTKKVDSQTITIKTSDYKADENGLFHISIAVKDNAGNESETLTKDIYLDTQAPIVETAKLDLIPSIDNLAMKTLGYVPFSANQLLVSVPITDSLSGINQEKTQLIVKNNNDIIKRYNVESVKEGKYLFKVDRKDISLTMYLSTEDNLVNKVDEQRLSYTMNSEAMDLPILLDTNKPIVSNEKINTSVIQLDGKDWIKENTTISYLISDLIESTKCSGLKSIDLTINGVKQNIDIDSSKEVDTQEITVNTANYQAYNNGEMQIIIKVSDNSGNEYTFSRFIYVDLNQPQLSVTYDNNTADKEYIHVYKADRVATLTLKEMNFDFSLINVQVTEDGVTRNINPSWGLISGTSGTTSAIYQAKVVFNKNVDYIFSVTGNDKVGHTLNHAVNETFTVDKIRPILTISYDNNRNTNNNYYAQNRTATLRVEEHNFDSKRFNVIGTATDNGTRVNFPTLSSWKNTGDIHTATITFNRDAYYKLDCEYVDKAGNSISDFVMQDFYVDKTVPEIHFSGVEKNSTNTGSVIPVVQISDTNYDNNGISLTYSGAHRGTLKFDGSKSSGSNGETFTFTNLAKKKINDDVYTIHAKVKDKAGNSSESDITYSVNRFGSTYQMSDELNKILSTKYITNCDDVVFSEINVNTIKNVVVKLSINGQIKELKQDDDYTVRRIDEKSWNRYIYTIKGSLFDSDGIYQIIVNSIDSAGNVNENIIESKKANIVFTVDKTAPTIAISGIDNNGIYNTNKKSVQILAEDNIELSNLEILLNNQSLSVSKDEYSPTIEIPESNTTQTLKATAYDKAGNKYETDLLKFTISTNFFVRLYMNKPLFFSSIAAITIILGGGIYIGLKKKKDKKESKN